jgi:hypothetical protein
MYKARNPVIARVEFLKSLNGTEIKDQDRKDAELQYLREAYIEFMRDVL